MNDYKLKILRNERVGDGIYEMLLTRPEGVDPKGAQFIHIKLKNGSRILRRPFCICDCTESGILICYAAVGEGTKELASKKAKPAAYLGYANKGRVVLDKLMQSLCPTVVATDDGSFGRKGYITDILAEDITSGAIKPDVIFCCGPEIVYKLLLKNPAFADIPIFVSLEKRMGCGVGACLVCACAVKAPDGSVVHKRACADGPVFSLEEAARFDPSTIPNRIILEPEFALPKVGLDIRDVVATVALESPLRDLVRKARKGNPLAALRLSLYFDQPTRASFGNRSRFFWLRVADALTRPGWGDAMYSGVKKEMGALLGEPMKMLYLG